MSDLDEIAKIEKEAFPKAWSHKTFIKELENNFAHYLVGLLADEIVVYIGGWFLDDRVHITTLATKVEYRQEGLAKEILAEFLARAKEENKSKVSLEVRVSNKKAQQLYLKEGFFKIAKKRGYYKDNGEDAILMWKQL